MVTVIVPWRPQPSRVPAFDVVVAWYRRHVPEAVIRPVDGGREEAFNLARSRNRGIASVTNPDDVVVVTDADTVPEIEPLRAALAAAAGSGLVHLPYTEYRWLGRVGTAQFTAGAPAETCDHTIVRNACSGVYVTTPATWWRHGGQDERFRGWGFEDTAWFTAHVALLGGEPVRHPGRVYALDHEPQTRQGALFEANEALMRRYSGAAGRPDVMRQLVAEAVATAANARSGPGVESRDADTAAGASRGSDSTAATASASSLAVAPLGGSVDPTPALSTPAAPAN